MQYTCIFWLNKNNFHGFLSPYAYFYIVNYIGTKEPDQEPEPVLTGSWIEKNRFLESLDQLYID